MQEAEVSLRVALYYIQHKLTNEDVTVSIDGAHIKTGEKIHFDIWSFLSDNGCKKIEGDSDRWQGKYQVFCCSEHIIITSEAGSFWMERNCMWRARRGKRIKAVRSIR